MFLPAPEGNAEARTGSGWKQTWRRKPHQAQSGPCNKYDVHTPHRHMPLAAIIAADTDINALSTEDTMAKGRPITDEELEEIRQSVREARFAIKFTRKGLRKFNQEDSNFVEIVHDEETLLSALRFDTGRESYPLNSPVVKEIVESALHRKNSDFFIKLGKVLTCEPLVFGNTGEPNRVEAFLLDHWAEAKDGLPELFYLNSESLADVCAHVLNPGRSSEEEHTPEALVKVRQRLRLKTFKRNKKIVRLVGNRLKFQQLDK